MIKLTQLFFFLDVGGVERKIVDLMNQLPGAEFDKQLILSHGAGMMARQLTPGCEVVVLPEKHKLITLIELLRDREISHIHTTNENPFFLWAASLANCPVIINAIEGSIVSPWSHYTDVEVCESETVRRHQPRPGRTEIIRNGIHVPATLPDRRLRRAAKPVLIEVKRAGKNMQCSLETSFRQLKAATPDMEAWIIGSEGRDEDGLLYFGKINHVGHFLQHADFLLNLSTHEASSNAVVEAMAHGVIPIVSAIGGNKEIVENGVNGFTIDEHDHGEIVRRITQILDEFKTNPGEYAKIRLRAHAFARKHFPRSKMLDQYEKLYRGMLRSPAPHITKHLSVLLDNTQSSSLFLDMIERYCFHPGAGIEGMSSISAHEISAPQYAFIQTILARENLKHNNLTVAEKQINGALQAWPEAFYTALTGGQLYKALGDLDKAAHCFRMATKADPEHIEASFGYLECLLAMEAFAEAETLAGNILRQLPVNHVMHSTITVLLQHLEKQAR